jgi:hypothetical protein
VSINLCRHWRSISCSKPEHAALDRSHDPIALASQNSPRKNTGGFQPGLGWTEAPYPIPNLRVENSPYRRTSPSDGCARYEPLSRVRGAVPSRTSWGFRGPRPCRLVAPYHWPTPAGRALGIAAYRSLLRYAAVVAHVEINPARFEFRESISRSTPDTPLTPTAFATSSKAPRFSE